MPCDISFTYPTTFEVVKKAFACAHVINKLYITKKVMTNHRNHFREIPQKASMCLSVYTFVSASLK